MAQSPINHPIWSDCLVAESNLLWSFGCYICRADSGTGNATIEETTKNLGIYAAIGAGGSIFQVTMDLTFLLSCAGASKLIHEKLLYRIMRSPMSFFDTNPMGRILNRFSSDVDVVDGQLPFQVWLNLNCKIMYVKLSNLKFTLSLHVRNLTLYTSDLHVETYISLGTLNLDLRLSYFILDCQLTLS